MPPAPRTAALSALAVAAATAIPLALPAAAQAATPTHLVINEVYGGGGNSGATLTNDFIEIGNPTSAPIAVDGWSVQYASSTGTSWQTTPLAGSVPAGGTYLVQEAAGTGGTAALPTPDATGSMNLSGTAGKVALVSSTAALSGANPVGGTTVVDFVGYGTANAFEGTGAAPATTNTTSDSRTGFADTDDNSKDFVAGAPTPANSGGGTSTGGGGTGPVTGLKIHDIQGAAMLSPYAGKQVAGVPGIVTEVTSTGFYLQDPNPDSNDATSEGVFVFGSAAAKTVTAGDSITVDGTVAEYRPGGTSDPDGLSVTEIDSPTVHEISSGNALPAPVVVGAAGRTPPTSQYDQPGDTAGNVEDPTNGGTFDPTKSGIDFWESLEGMRVEVDDAQVVGPTNSYGETAIVADHGAEATGMDPRGGIVATPTDFNPERVVVSDSLGATVPAANVGDQYTQVVGVMNFDFDEYMIDATQPVTRVDNGLQPTTAPPAAAGQLSFATFNVENLAPTDPQTKFDRLASIVGTDLGTPDVVAVEEIQDDDGATDDGVVDATQTYAKLIAAIKAATGVTYSYTQIDPVNDQDGGEPGGNIRQGFLFRTDRGLSLAPGTAGTSTQADSVDTSGNLTLNPGRIDPTSTAWASSRKPLVGEFLDNGQPIYLIANHWDAKLGDDPLFGKDQPPAQSSEVQRVQQATEVNTFVKQLQAVSPNARIAVLGDLNDYSASPSVQELLNGTGLTDLITTLPQDEQYTYDYEGNSEVLDHILVSQSLLSGLSYHVVHVNAEFADQASDHDPQVVTVAAPAPPTPTTVTEWVSPTGKITTGGTSCSKPGFRSVQAAIDAGDASGATAATVELCAGTYAEQLTLHGSESVALTAHGAATLALPANPATRAACDSSGVLAVVAVCAGSTTLTGVTVTATAPAGSAAPVYGVLSGTGATVKLVKSNVTAAGRPTPDTQPTGVGLRAQSGSHLTLSGSAVSGFGVDGVEADGSGTTAAITSSTVHGAGDAALIAQHGIVGSGGAVVTISKSDVDDVRGGDGASAIQLVGVGAGSAVTGTAVTDSTSGIVATAASASAPLSLTTDDVSGSSVAAIVLGPGRWTVTSDTIEGPGGVGLQLVQRAGDPFAVTATVSKLSVSGLSTAAVDIDSDASASDVPGSLSLTSSKVSNNPSGASTLGSIRDDSQAFDVSLSKLT